ncbi:hypothetical protein GCM10020216_016090 [Nonomuraea helvata]
MVVAAVGEHDVGALTGLATLATHLGDGVQERAELGDVVAVGASQDDACSVLTFITLAFQACLQSCDLRFSVRKVRTNRSF